VRKLRRYPRLASTLEHVATRGLDDLYRSELASALASEFARLDVPLRLPDLAAHRASIVTPLSAQRRAGTAYNLPPPTQGLTSLMILGIFERLNCNGPEGFEHAHGVVEATKQAEEGPLARSRPYSRVSFCGQTDEAVKSWYSSHPSRGPGGGCSQDDLKSTGGNGLLYCFATN
jgi:gamma-glutamyltranspeptidase